jgi:ankyrin repeat protein
MEVRQLFEAAQSGSQATVRELLDIQRISVDACDQDGNTALHFAAANGHEQVAEDLIMRRCLIDFPSHYGWTALMQAASYAHIPVVKLLLQHKANPNLPNSLGCTALVAASRAGHASVVHALLAHGALPHHESWPISALSVAAQHGHESVVRLLLDKGCDVNYKAKDTGWTPLMLAALNGWLPVVKILVSHGADANILNTGDLTAMDVAAARGHDAVEAFLEQRTKVMSKTAWSKTLRMDIFEAAKRGDYDTVKHLLDGDQVDANRQDDDGATCLMFAAMRGHAAVVELLAERGANIDAQDAISGWTALMQATYYGHKAVSRLLIDHGANVNIQAKNGCTAFDIASIIGDTEVVRLLAAVSMRNAGGRLRPVAATTALSPPLSAELLPVMAAAPRDTDATLRALPQARGPHDTIRPEAVVMEMPRIRESWWDRMANRFWRLKSGAGFSLMPSLIPNRSRLSRAGGGGSAGAGAGGGDITSTPTVRLQQVAAGPKARPKYAATQEPSPRRKPSLQALAGKEDSSDARDAIARRASFNMGAPTSKLPDDILAPIKPPFLPPPAFDLSHIGNAFVYFLSASVSTDCIWVMLLSILSPLYSGSTDCISLSCSHTCRAPQAIDAPKPVQFRCRPVSLERILVINAAAIRPHATVTGTRLAGKTWERGRHGTL